MQNIKSKIKDGSKKIGQEIRQKTFGYLLTAFGLVAALAWNDAIRGLIEYLFPINKDGVSAKFLYAGVITLVVVLISVYLTRLLGEKKE